MQRVYSLVALWLLDGNGVLRNMKGTITLSPAFVKYCIQLFDVMENSCLGRNHADKMSAIIYSRILTELFWEEVFANPVL